MDCAGFLIGPFNSFSTQQQECSFFFLINRLYFLEKF